MTSQPPPEASVLPASAQEGGPSVSADIAALFFENSLDLFAVTDYDGRILQVNPAWTRALGWLPEEICGQTIPALTHVDDRNDVRAGGHKIRTEGFARHTHRLPCKNGEWRWLQGHIRLTETRQLIAVYRDITDDREYQAELQNLRRVREMLSEAAGVASWSYDPVERRMRWSHEMLNMLGPDAALRDTPEAFAEIVHPDDRARVGRGMQEAVETGKSGSLAHRILGSDGRWRHLLTYRAESHPSGRYALHVLCQDVTELAEARDAALGAEQQVRQLVEAAPFAAAMYDKSLRHLVVSPQWLAVFGLSRDDYLGRSLDAVFSHTRRQFMAAQRRALLGEVVSRAEDRFVDADGVSRWVRWEMRPWRDTMGEIAGVIAYVDDISALVVARREADANAQRLKLAMRAAQAGVFEIDYAAQTFWCSPEFSQVVGRKLDFADVRTPAWSNLHPDDVEMVRAAVAAWDPKHPTPIETRVLLPDGAERWVRLYYELKHDARGKARKSVGLMLDIDERKRQELALVEAERRALAATEAKSSFLANMSHEIRTPMNGVLGVLQLLKAESISDKGQGLLDEALGCGRMLAELLNDVMDFSKIEAGRLELSPEPMEPTAVLEGVASILRTVAEAKGLWLRVRAEPDIGWAALDPVRLRQALFNLLGNAVKFTNSGGIEARLSAKAGPDGRRLRFEIQDTGVGIAKDAQASLFERFYQADGSNTRRFSGSGLGLSITKRLAEMMGGDVGFLSEAGKGSTFWIEIAATEIAAPSDEAEEEAETSEIAGLRALVVDDNATNRIIISRLLEAFGVSVETAENGRVGVEAAVRGGFDLIFMDVQMPEMDGVEATRHIRAAPGPVALTPIIALTANVMAHQRTAYRGAGMDGVVAKPVDALALYTEAARLAGTQHLPLEIAQSGAA